MMAYKITDDEMRYYQFKAKQLFQLQKENYEWRKYCEENKIKKCESCIVKENQVEKSKTIGVQVSQPKSINKGKIQSVTSKPHLSHNFELIKSKLNKIDQALAHLEKRNSPLFEEVFNNDISKPDIMNNKATEEIEKKCELIQKSFRLTLQRLEKMAPWNFEIHSRNKLNIKNSSFFIPHDLKRQRIFSKRAYLASLPKQNVKDILSKEKEQKESVPTQPKKIAYLDSRSAKSPQSKYIQIKQPNALPPNLTENQDINIENALDKIVDDLLKEIAASTAKIIEKKKHKIPNEKINFLMNIIKNMEDEESNIRNKWNLRFNQLDKYITSTKINGNETILLNKSDPTLPKEKFQETWNVSESNKLLMNREYLNGDNYKYTCNLQPMESLNKIELALDNQMINRIIKYRKQYKKYLQSISRYKTKECVPWHKTNIITDALIDELIEEVAQELKDIPSSILTQLFEKEFIN